MKTLLILVLFALSSAAVFADEQPCLFEDTLVPVGYAISGEEIYVRSIRISPDLRHIAYVSRIGSNFWVWLDGVSGEKHSGITMESPFFSPGKNRLAYVANEEDKMFAVVDGKKHPRFKSVGKIAFSPDGSRVAYRAENDKGRQMVAIDGEPGPLFDVGVNRKVGIIFSPDSRHVAYVGLNKTGSHIFVKNNKRMRGFQEIGSILFSPDSNHFAYTAKENNKWKVVFDDKKGPEYDMVSGLTFSPDSSQLVYSAQKSGRPIIVKNDKEIDKSFSPAFSFEKNRFAYLLLEKNIKFRYVIDGEKEPVIMDKPGRLIFSKDETSTAYAALIDDKWHVIKNGLKGPGFKEIYAFSFSPATNDIMYAAENDEGKTCVVNNDVAGKFYDSIGIPKFSPDGEKYGYAARKNEKEMFMVINGEEQKPFPLIGIPMEEGSGETGLTAQHPFFSPRGNRVAYAVYDTDNKKAFMVVDGKTHPCFDLVLRPYFTEDEKHIIYMAKTGDVWRMVVDGQAGTQTCKGLIKGADIGFDAPNRCYVLVANEKETGLAFFRLEAEIKNPS